MPLRRALILAALVLSAAPLPAQTLRDDIRQLFTFGNCGQPLCLDGSQLVGHGDHFIPAQAAGAGTIISFLTSSIGVAISNLPISAASSGVTYRFEGGVPVRTSSSGGPVFAERAQTLGRKRFFIGANVTAQRFERLRGVRLDNLQFSFAHAENPPIDTLGQPSYENDIIAVSVSMDVSLLVTTGFLYWGVVDGVDLGIAVPFVHTGLSGESVAQIQPFGASTPHYFGTDANGNPILTAVSGTEGAATGIGDVAARLKVSIHQSDKVGVAVLADARFPTGDADNLLGAGAFSGRGLAIASLRFGDFSPHVNLGYVFRDDTLQSNGLLATVGFDHLLASWATLALDFISEWQTEDPKLQVPGPIVYQYPFPRTVQSTSIPVQRDDQLAMSVGMKFATSRGLTLVWNGLVPLRDSGVQPSVVWTGGLEYNF
jgi:hypothetical protein